MSKRVTQILSLILTLVMFLSVSTQAFAFGGIGLGDGWDREIGEDEIRDFDGPVEEEEEVDYFQTLNEDTGVQVTVEAPMGALPSLAELRAEPVEAEDIRDAVDSVVEGEPQILLALDISFWLYGQEIEPEEPVRVKITAPELEDKTGLTLVHIPDEAAPETVDFIGEEDMSFALGANEVAFVADSFSVYAITWDGEKTAKIHWGYMENGTFTPFDDVASLDSNAGSMSLDVIFDDYMYSSAVYVKGDAEYGLDSKILTKVTADGVTSWTLQAYVPVGDEGETELQTVTIEDGADIYVYYVKKAESYTPPDPAPADVKGPITDKNVTPNGDGTYTIRLDITGQQDHTVNKIGANVIVILDRTSSMNTTISGSTSRMAAARTALQTLINTLNPGTGDDQNLINFTVVGFANRAAYYDELAWTQDKTAMLNYARTVNYVSGTAGNGTPWQSGLYGGIVRANDATTNDDLKKNKTYVIFVTDGDPNGYYTNANSDGGPANNPNYQSPPTSAFRRAAYDAAIPNAVNLSTKVEHRFYGVYCGGADDSGKGHLQDLMSERYNGNSVSGTFIDGTSENAIVAAFQGIAQTIVNDLGASEVVVDDGVPALTNVSAAVSGSAGGFKYYIKPKNGTETVWTDAPSAAYSSSNGVTWDLSKSGVLADGTVYSLEFTVWPSQAAYDLLANLSNGMPGWTLGELDDATLEQLVVTVGTEDYEYTPGETEGTGTWAVSGSTDEGMSTEEFLEFMKGKTVDYNVLTNTHLTTTYKYGNSTYTDPPKNGMNSGAMILDTTYFGVHKLWNNGIDFRTANALYAKDGDKRYITDPGGNFILDDGGNKIEYDKDHPDPRTWLYVDLIVTEDDEVYTEIRLYNKPYKDNDEWSWNKMYIAPGVLTHDSGNSGALTILEAGRDYSVKEKPAESYYWNQSAETYHPMVINGVAWVLQLVDEDDASAPDLADNTFQGDYYNIEGEIFKKLGTADDALITAVNDRRSMLYVSKEVEGDGAPEDEVFTFSITLDSPKDPHPDDENYDDYYNTFWFAIQEDPHNRDTIIMDDEDIVIDGATPEVEAGSPTGFYWFDNGGTVTVSVKAGQYITFSNLPLDTKYTISELGEDEMPEGFIFKDAKPGAERNIVGFDPTAGKVDKDNPMKVAGTIDASNSDYFITFTNKYLGYFYVYHSADNTVQRFPMAVNGVAYSADNPFDINALTKDGTLYGGYYKDYAGKSEGFDAAALDYSGSTDPADADGTPYSLDYIKESNKAAWSDGETVSGKAMVPVADTVYFLKEVPTAYLQPYTYYTYYKADNKIGNIWAISDLDDLNYSDAGFYIYDAQKGTTSVVSTLSIKATNSTTTVKLTAFKLFNTKHGVKDGYLSYWKFTDDFMNTKVEIKQYWTTPDGIEVLGTHMRTMDTTGEYGYKGMIVSSDDLIP